MRIGGILVFLAVFICALVFPGKISAQVVVNEVFPNPVGIESGAEWIELFNTTNEVLSLKDCILHLHATDNNQQVVFGDEAFINDYEVVSWGSSWLNNSGDQVRLACPSFSDSVSYGNADGSVIDEPEDGKSIGRSPNGTGNFYILATVTMGGENSVPPTPTPTPTNTPTSTPKPTPTKKPTSTPTNTPTPKPTVKAKTTTASPTPIKTSPGAAEGNEEDGERSVSDTKEGSGPSPTEEKEKASSTKFPLFAGIFIVAGIGFMGASLHPFYKKRRSLYNEESGKETFEEDS